MLAKVTLSLCLVKHHAMEVELCARRQAEVSGRIHTPATLPRGTFIRYPLGNRQCAPRDGLNVTVNAVPMFN
jgi:hypothetical protein